jgi:hypothetical protein
MIRDFLEDKIRKKTDLMENNKKFAVMKNGVEIEVLQKDIKEGDLIIIKRD